MCEAVYDTIGKAYNRIRNADARLVERDVGAGTGPCREFGVVSKVIIEAALLTDDEKMPACMLAQGAGAEFRIETFLCQPCAGFTGQLKGDSQFRNTVLNVFDHQTYHLHDLLLGQRMEDDGVVDTV